eukprot:6228349-Pyramimonas_sp.AAC.1
MATADRWTAQPTTQKPRWRPSCCASLKPKWLLCEASGAWYMYLLLLLAPALQCPSSFSSFSLLSLLLFCPHGRLLLTWLDAPQCRLPPLLRPHRLLCPFGPFAP